MKQITAVCMSLLLIWCASGFAIGQQSPVSNNDYYTFSDTDQYQLIGDYKLKIKSQAEQEKMSKAIDDYIAGRSIKLPDYMDYKESPYYIYYKNYDYSKYVMPDDKLPSLVSITSIESSSNKISQHSTQEENTFSTYYQLFGNRHQGLYAGSIECNIEGSTIALLQDATLNGGMGDYMDELVMHLWCNTGTSGQNGGAEECIQILNRGSDQQAVFNIYDETHWAFDGSHYRERVPYPITDSFKIFIKAWTFGSNQFNLIEFGVFDLTTGVGFDQIYQVPTCSLGDADIAIEKKYASWESRVESGQWKVASNVIVYQGNDALVDLYNTCHSSERPVSGINYANHTHFYSYRNVPNAMANVYLTRYNTIRPIDP